MHLIVAPGDRRPAGTGARKFRRHADVLAGVAESRENRGSAHVVDTEPSTGRRRKCPGLPPHHESAPTAHAAARTLASRARGGQRNDDEQDCEAAQNRSRREDHRHSMPCSVAGLHGAILHRIATGFETSLKKSFPLSSTTMNAGKSRTSIFHTASMPSSGYSSTSTLVMQSLASRAAGPPIEPR